MAIKEYSRARDGEKKLSPSWYYNLPDRTKCIFSFLAILGQIRYNTTIENQSVMEEMDV